MSTKDKMFHIGKTRQRHNQGMCDIVNMVGKCCTFFFFLRQKNFLPSAFFKKILFSYSDQTKVFVKWSIENSEDFLQSAPTLQPRQPERHFYFVLIYYLFSISIFIISDLSLKYFKVKSRSNKFLHQWICPNLVLKSKNNNPTWKFIDES